ncbi:MAG: T9SS type A sorting domain-containing protein [Flavobacteriales bacterium]|nr:T9SS type A sorting domain-containing protein [Flavobacteriales bacterium]
MITILNEDLICIEVDDPLYSDTTWTVIDDWTSFSEDCSNFVDCSVFDTAPVDLTKSFDPVDGVEDRVQVKWFKASPQVRYSDEDAAMCDIKFWPKRDLDPVTGDPIGPAYVAPDTVFINDKVKTYPGGAPREIFKWPVKYRADGANNAKRAEPNIRYEWQVRCECGHDGNGQESPWSEIKIFNTPDFDPVTGINGSPSVQGAATKGLSHDQGAWSIAPNPNNGESLSITWDTPLENDYSIRLYDLTGKQLMDRQITPSKGRTHRLELPQGLHPGIYLVQCTMNGLTTTKRLMVQ